MYTQAVKVYRKHSAALSFYGVCFSSLLLKILCVCVYAVKTLLSLHVLPVDSEERLIGDFRCLNIMLQKDRGHPPKSMRLMLTFMLIMISRSRLIKIWERA